MVIAAIALAPTALAESSGPAPVDPARLRAIVDREAAANRLPGVSVGVVNGAGVTTFASHGTLAGNERITPDTPFILGSVSKTLTAVAVLQLVEARAVDLDAQLVRYVPGFDLDDHEIARRITVRQLLNHTSGLPVTACETESADLDAFVRSIRSAKPDRAPGSRYEYCSGNYNLLGALVEHVSGQPFGAYMREHLFLPLGMRSAGADEATARASGVAQGHTWAFGVAVPLDYYNPSGVPAGYLSASARDMTRFLAFELGGSNAAVLSSAAVERSQKGAVDAGSGARYGMGWLTGRIGGVRAVYHYGTTYTYEAFIVLEPQNGRAAVVMVDAQGLLAVPAVRHLEKGITALLADRPVPAPGLLTIPHLYGAVDLLMLGLLLLAVRALVRAVRGTAVPKAGRRVAARGAAEVGGAVLLVILVRLFLGNLGARNWEEILRLLPDVVGWLLVVCTLMLLTGLVRLLRLRTRPDRY